MEQQLVQEGKARLREDILKGTDNPTKWIENWERMRKQLEEFESRRLDLETRRMYESERLGEEYIRRAEHALHLAEDSRQLSEYVRPELRETRERIDQLRRELFRIRGESVLVPMTLFWILIGVGILLIANLIAILFVREWGLPLVLILIAVGLVVWSVKAIRE